jgi:hypothetical protein
MRVRDVEVDDVRAIHRKLSKAGKLHQANRVVAVVSMMFAKALEWKLRLDDKNPAKNIARNREQPRTRHLEPEELGRFLNQAWSAATESDRRAFYGAYFPANVMNRFQT